MNSSIGFLIALSMGVILNAAETPPVEQPEQAPEAPTAMTWRASSLPEETTDQGITTTAGDYRGNWVIKKEIARLARQVYELVRAAALVVDAVKKDFLAARTAAEGQLNTFYTEIGYQQGEIDESLDQMTKEIAQKKEQEASLTTEEQRFLAELTEKKNEVEQVKKDLTIIQELDASLNKAFAIALEQIELARSYEQRAWENYDKISEVLSDEIAERLYLEIQGFKSNIDSITYYLNQELLVYLGNTQKKLQEQMLQLKNKISDLKARGILLEKNIEQFAAQKLQQEPKKEIKRTWYQQIWYAITYPFVYVHDLIASAASNVYYLFGGKKKAPSTVQPIAAAKLTPVEVSAAQAGVLAAAAMPSTERAAANEAVDQDMMPQVDQIPTMLPVAVVSRPIPAEEQQVPMPVQAPVSPMTTPTEVTPLPVPSEAMLPIEPAAVLAPVVTPEQMMPSEIQPPMPGAVPQVPTTVPAPVVPVVPPVVAEAAPVEDIATPEQAIMPAAPIEPVASVPAAAPLVEQTP